MHEISLHVLHVSVSMSGVVSSTTQTQTHVTLTVFSASASQCMRHEHTNFISRAALTVTSPALHRFIREKNYHQTHWNLQKKAWFILKKSDSNNIFIFKEYHTTKIFIHVFIYTVLLRSLLFDQNKNSMLCCKLIILMCLHFKRLIKLLKLY